MSFSNETQMIAVKNLVSNLEYALQNALEFKILKLQAISITSAGSWVFVLVHVGDYNIPCYKLSIKFVVRLHASLVYLFQQQIHNHTNFF